jgi:hypothetical protein
MSAKQRAAAFLEGLVIRLNPKKVRRKSAARSGPGLVS